MSVHAGWLRWKVLACLALLLGVPGVPVGASAPLPTRSQTRVVAPPAITSNEFINARHSGYSPATIAPPLRRKWAREFKTTLNDALLSYPLVADGRVFVTVQGDYGETTLYAVRASTGSTIWKRTFPDYSGAWTALEGNTIYALTRAGTLTAMRTETGGVRWRRDLTREHIYSFHSPPTAVGGSVYVSAAGVGGEVVAVASTGRIRWRSEVGGTGAPAVGGGRVFVNRCCPHIYGLDASGGGRIWHRGGFPHGGGSPPVSVYAGRVYAQHWSSYVLDARNGRLLDSYYSEFPPAVHGDILITLEAGVLHAVRRTTHAHRWAKRLDVGPDRVSPPVIVGPVVYATSSDGMLHALALSDGHEVWSSRVVPLDEVWPGVYGRIGVGSGRLVVASREWLVAYED
jgi:outer membrane protein assembly factor BamB